MLRYTSKDGTELTMRYSRSLSRYSESYLHVQTDVPNTFNKFILFIVFLAFLFDSLLLSSGITIFPDFLEAIYGVPGICVLFSIPPFVLIVSNPLATYLVDHKGPKTPLLYGICLSLLSSSTFSYALSLHNHKPVGYGLILFALSIHGLATALTTRGGISLVTMSHTEAIRGSAFRFILSGAALGLIIGPVTGGSLYMATSAYTPYLLLATLFAIVLLLLLPVYNGGHSVLVSEVDDAEDMRLHLLPIDGSGLHGELGSLDWVALVDLITNRHMLICLGACLVGSMAPGIMAPLLPTFMRQTLDLSPGTQGLVYALIPLSAFVFSPVVASLSDMSSSVYSTRSMAEGGPSSPRYNVMFAGITLIGMALCSVVWVSNVFVLAVVLVALGVGQTCLQTPSMPLIADIAEWKGYEDYSSAAVLSETAIGVGLTIGPLVAGGIQLATGGGSRGFTAACFILGICCLGYSVSVVYLRGVGKRLGEDALDLDGSLYGRKSLDSAVEGGLGIVGGTLLQQRHFRDFSGADDDSAVF